MEYLNEEMDDLFRKAGEQYPLKTSDSDWDAVLGRLQPQTGNEFQAGQDSGDQKKRRNRRFFWLLLLLPLGLFSVTYFGGREQKNKTFTVVSPSPEGNQQGSVASRTTTTNNPGTDFSAAEDGKNSSAEKPNEGRSKSSEDILSGNREGSGFNRFTTTRKAFSKKAHSLPATVMTDREGFGTAAHPLANSDNPETMTNREPENPEMKDPKKGIAVTPTENSTALAKAGDQKQTGKAANDHTATSDSRPPVKSSSTTQDSTRKTAEISSKKKSRSKEKGIYLSLMVGPDLSTVKFQSVKKTGFSIGLLAGYRFNKHIAAETGLLWDRKQYYSEGQYFDKSKTRIPPNVRITDLDGNCDMFEIPLHIRYDFRFTRKGRFFSTGGLSTYIMKKESYDYSAEAYGTSWSRNVSYPNSGNNIFSILELSAGYEYQLGKIGRIRIEPYFKIPLSGIGIGSLPISSAGLYLGITHPFR